MARRIGATSAERSVPTLTRKGKSQSPQSQRPTATSGPTTTAGRPAGGRGGVQGVNLIILVLVAASVVIAAGLLAKTVNTARSIDGKAKSISSSGGTINESTDAIAQLVQTNKIARSILKTASPLDGVLTKIVNTAAAINSDARSIDGLATSITSTAGTINTTASGIGGSATSINSVATEINTTAGTIDDVAGQINRVAGQINSTAKAINTTVGPGAGILGIARIIDNDADQIITTLNKTLGIAQSIKVDSGNILVVSDRILDTAGCIDNKLPGPNKPANSCNGKP
jgi:methyl-accepting chemotaxis protein